MNQYKSNHYYNYQELTELLKDWAHSYSHLCQLESIGKSLEGRDLWLMTVTDSSSGGFQDKSAYWIDGNTHALEMTGSQAALHTIDKLVRNFKKDDFITQLLKDHTFYILPRIAVDGVELFLKESYFVRSSPVNWPERDCERSGLEPQDIDANGLILRMRVKDENGLWKKSKLDPRIMIPRLPDDIFSKEEEYYQIYPEGYFKNYRGFQKHIPNRHGIDFNRQFPSNWIPEGEQKGAGPFPLSQPETFAVAKAITDRPNIVGAQSYHTFSGVILRPFTSVPDAEMNLHDFSVYEALGKRGEEITGYKCISIYHDYRYDHDDKTGGSFTEWAYNHLGLYVFTTELWNIGYKAGIDIEKPIEWLSKGIAEEDEIKVIAWCDENLEKGSYFVEWAKFDHPQLGHIEVGGWKYAFTWSNPPKEFLTEEVEKNVNFTLACAASNPKVHIHSINEKIIAYEGTAPIRKVSLVVENKGYLPTYGSKRALEAGVVSKPQLYVTMEESLELLSGYKELDFDHLEGRTSNYRLSSLMLHAGYPNQNTRSFEWVIKGTGNFEVSFLFHRGGNVKHTFGLDASVKIKKIS